MMTPGNGIDDPQDVEGEEGSDDDGLSDEPTNGDTDEGGTLVSGIITDSGRYGPGGSDDDDDDDTDSALTESVWGAGYDFGEEALYTTDDPEGYSTHNYEIDYASAESSRLSEKFGSIYSVSEILENAITTMATDIVNSTMRVEYNFKKVRQPRFTAEELTAFETEETAQGVAITATTMVSDLTTTTTPEGY
jgi:hypothetical protein